MARLIVLVLLACGSVFAQQTSTTPDCQFSYVVPLTTGMSGTSVAAPANSTPAGTPCIKWRVSYQTSSATAFTTLHVSLRGAPDAAGVAGTFTLWTGTGTIEIGSNPATDAVNSTFVAGPGTATNGVYFPWVDILIDTVTGAGTINVKVLGYRGTNPAAPGSAGTTANVNLADVNGHTTQECGQPGCLAVGGVAAAGQNLSTTGNPNIIGGSDFGGTPKIEIPHVDTAGNTYGFLGCNQQAQIILVSTSYTTILSASGSTQLRMCKVFVTSASGGNPNVNTFTAAFGPDCTMAPTAVLTGAGITGIDSDFGGALRGAAGDAFCLKESVGNGDAVTVTYSRGVF